MRAREGPRGPDSPAFRRRTKPAWPVGRGARVALALLAAGLALEAAPAVAWYDPGDGDLPPSARGVHVVDGSCVMNVGQLQVNITNWGLIGSRYTMVTTYADAPSAQWPAGSGIEYLWAMGLWLGGKVNEEVRVSTGQPQAELRPLPDVESTIYEAVDGRLVRPPGNAAAGGGRFVDDDGDGRTDEDVLDGVDNDRDGLIDEDFAQIGDQMMVCTMYDNTRLASEIYPDHQPLGLRLRQETYAWENPDFDDFVAFRYVLTNVSPQIVQDLYLGIYVDCDIGRRGQPDIGEDDMVGLWQGRARGSDGYFADIQVAYMYDGAEEGRVPGYFGVMLLGGGGSAFRRAQGFHIWSGQRAYELGGEPDEDSDRYELMSRAWRDPDTTPGHEADYRFLMASGPLWALHPGRSASFYLALVAGDGLDGLLENCANVERAWFGEFVDADEDPLTGLYGRETWTCAEWWPLNATGRKSVFYEHDARFWDGSCLSPNTSVRLIKEEDTVLDALGNHCTWVNMDNCQECERQMGQQCTRANRLFEYWNCGHWYLPEAERMHCTGIGGRETQVNWIVLRNAPPSPSLRLVPDQGAVHLFWDDVSEHATDPATGVVDFESYMLWRADDWDRPPGTSVANGPRSETWQMIDEYDLVDEYERTYRSGQETWTVVEPLGRNTGLEAAAYRPRCLDDERFAGLAEAMQEVVDADTSGRHPVRPALRRADGSPVPGLEPLLRWESWPAVLDTFFMVAERPADPDHGDPGKRSVRFYEHVDRDVHDGFLYFYSVTASDREVVYVQGEPHVTGPGLHGSPGAGFATAVPAPRGQTVAERERLGCNIYVYPDPATRESLAEFQQMAPNGSDPSGVRIVFRNLPLARDRVRVYTLDGDLVADLDHDGRLAGGQLPWNLVSRNGQKIASGIYLYRVESDDPGFEPFTGRFVVIR